MKIHYFNALAGAGKTRAMAQVAHRMAIKGERVLFVQPSKKLIDDTLRNEVTPLRQLLSDRRRYACQAIHGDQHAGVVTEIMTHIRKDSDTDGGCGGELLFITHESFLRLPYFPRRHRWIVMFDEIPSADHFEDINIPDTYALITDSLQMTPEGPAWGRLIAKTSGCNNEHSLSAIARNRSGDEVYKLLSGLARRVLSTDWRVYVLQSQYARLVHGPKHAGQGEEGRSRRLIACSLLQPSIFQGFKKTILAGALLEDSVLFRLWSGIGVEFEPVGEAFFDALRYQRHDNGHLITIQYFDDADWSKSRRDRALALDSADGEVFRVKDGVARIIREEMAGRPFAWMGNKDLADDFFQSERAVRLPNSPHGLNSFQHLHNVVVVSALNAPPAHFRFMKDRGVEPDQLRRAHYQSAVYQAVMRISVRDPNDMTPKTVVVMDKSTATWLAQLFPGAVVKPLGSKLDIAEPGQRGRTRIHDSAGDRAVASRKRKQALKAELKALGANGKKGAGGEHGYGSVFATIYSKQAAAMLDAADDNAFVKLLTDMHRRIMPSKESNFLISPATFNSAKPGVSTQRGVDNIEYLRGIWLDNDGGDLSPEEFAQMFPSLRMAVWNTFSSTAESPRWRCFIPTSEAMTPTIYSSLIGQIVEVLRAEGYVSDPEIAKRNGAFGHKRKRHGFDVGKFCASSLFYAPCQAKYPTQSFFIDYAGGNRAALDVQLWIDNDRRSDSGEPETVAEPTPTDIEGSYDRVEAVHAAVQRWRSAPRGEGHRKFFRLANDLERAGLSREEYAKQLYAEAGRAASPQDRRADAKQLVGRYLQ